MTGATHSGYCPILGILTNEKQVPSSGDRCSEKDVYFRYMIESGGRGVGGGTFANRC